MIKTRQKSYILSLYKANSTPQGKNQITLFYCCFCLAALNREVFFPGCALFICKNNNKHGRHYNSDERIKGKSEVRAT